jgi:glycosyltransferase involved in cell wall biosynthesis
LDNAEYVYKYAQNKEVKYIIDILDLWPDELIDILPGFMKPLGRVGFSNIYRKMSQICKKASSIMGVSQSYLDYGLRFAGREREAKDHLFPLGYRSADISETELKKAHIYWNESGINHDDFNICFFGTIGKYFNMDTVIQGGKILYHEFKINIILCGEGSSAARYKKLAADEPYIRFPGWVDEPKIRALMEISKAGLAPYSAHSKMSLPNKPFEYFAGRLPVISSIQGELKDILKKYNCGYTYPADSVAEFCDVIRSIYYNQEESKNMGNRGRKLLDEYYSHDKVFAAAQNHILKLIASLL